MTRRAGIALRGRAMGVGACPGQYQLSACEWPHAAHGEP